MTLPSVARGALPRPELPKAVLARPRRLAASPPPEGWLGLYLRPPIPRAIKICVHTKVASIAPKLCMQHLREILKRMTWPHFAFSFCTLSKLALE